MESLRPFLSSFKCWAWVIWWEINQLIWLYTLLWLIENKIKMIKTGWDYQENLEKALKSQSQAAPPNQVIPVVRLFLQPCSDTFFPLLQSFFFTQPPELWLLIRFQWVKCNFFGFSSVWNVLLPTFILTAKMQMTPAAVFMHQVFFAVDIWE